MKRILASLGLLALFGIPVQGAAAETIDDLSPLRKLESAFATAMNEKNVDGVMAVYAPGKSLFVFDVVGPPSAHVGSDAYRDAFAKMFAAIRGPLRLTLGDLHVTARGDFGYGRSLQRVSGVHAHDGKPFDYTVRVTDVYQKVGGKWLIVQEHLSLPIDRASFAPVLHE